MTTLGLTVSKDPKKPSHGMVALGSRGKIVDRVAGAPDSKEDRLRWLTQATEKARLDDQEYAGHSRPKADPLSMEEFDDLISRFFLDEAERASKTVFQRGGVAPQEGSLRIALRYCQIEEFDRAHSILTRLVRHKSTIGPRAATALVGIAYYSRGKRAALDAVEEFFPGDRKATGLWATHKATLRQLINETRENDPTCLLDAFRH